MHEMYCFVNVTVEELLNDVCHYTKSQFRCDADVEASFSLLYNGKCLDNIIKIDHHIPAKDAERHLATRQPGKHATIHLPSGHIAVKYH